MEDERKPVEMLDVCYGCGAKPSNQNQTERVSEGVAQTDSKTIKLQSCGRCRSNKYCSETCIKDHWKSRHKHTCPMLSIALLNPLSKTCQFWKCALKYEPMVSPNELEKYRTPELLSRLPVYALVEGQEDMFQIGPLGGCPEGLEFVTGFILQTLGLVEVLEHSAEKGFVENVGIYESGYLIGYSRVNEKVVELLCGAASVAVLKANKKMEYSVWKITGGYVPQTVPANIPLHTELTEQPLSTDDVKNIPSSPNLTMDSLLTRLPGYEFQNKSCKLHKKYLALAKRSEDAADQALTAHLLMSYKLLQVETDARWFVKEVKVYDEAAQQDVCTSNVLKKSVELLFGEDSVDELNNCKKISLETWLLTGGGSEENGFQPVLHQVIKK